jgi:hypothetical protein
MRNIEIYQNNDGDLLLKSNKLYGILPYGKFTVIEIGDDIIKINDSWKKTQCNLQDLWPHLQEVILHWSKNQ